MATQRAVPFPTYTAPIATSTATPAVYRPGLDAVRFFAFLAVLLHHGILASNYGPMARYPFLLHVVRLSQETLGFGLCLFFFLSAYLITSLLQVEKKRTGTIDLKKFYVRRILRIWPLYFMFLTAMFLLGLWWKKEAIEPMRLLALFLLAGNWYSLLHGWGAQTIVHLWSISVEEQYYLVWPTVCRFFGRGRLAAFCLIVCTVCLASTWMLAAGGASAHRLWLNSLTQSLFFAAGALLALRIGLREQRESIKTAAAYLCCGIALWYLAEALGALTSTHRTASPMRVTVAYALVAIGCSLLLRGVLRLPERALPAPLLYLGRISYGLYVYHFLVLTVLEDHLGTALHSFGVIVATLGITVGIAAASYEWLEKPFLRLKSRFELVTTRAV